MTQSSDILHTISARRRYIIVTVMRILVLALSVLLLAVITFDTVSDISFVTNPEYLTLQFWVCLFFLFDIAVELLLSPDRRKYLLQNIIFILVSIPYLSIIDHFHLHVAVQLQFILRFIPLIRTAYVFALITGMISRNWVSSMLSGYIILLVGLLYFLSLMFFVEEHFVNPAVSDYWQSLWFSVMQMTTAGSSISPVTYAGKVIGVVLSMAGLILFPVFTVYFTKVFAADKAQNQSAD